MSTALTFAPHLMHYAPVLWSHLVTAENKPRVHIVAVIEQHRVTALVQGSRCVIAEANDIWKLAALISEMFPQGTIIEPRDASNSREPTSPLDGDVFS